jgi:N-acetylneuraminate synthase
MVIKMKKITIGNKIVGENKPCFIIAEAGVNHNGELDLAKQLVNVAVDAGVDAVKFQTFKAEGVTTSSVGIAGYAKKNIGKGMKQINMIKNLELKCEEFRVLKEYCDKKEILFLSTPHSFDAIDFLDDLVPAYKFGSGDLTNIPALQHAAKKGKPIILGTGMSTLEEVKSAIDAITSEGNEEIIVLHCTTNYPCPVEEVNLNAMKTMGEELDCLVGYSDHTLGILVPIMAATLGAVVIEKHFTIDKSLPGPDHKASLEPNELKEMTKVIREVQKAMGNGIKKPTKEEEKIKKVVRKSIVAKVGLPMGKAITEQMLDIKRPGTGIEPEYWDKIIGKKARREIKKDEVLTWKMIE